jgi:hypothetical protein
MARIVRRDLNVQTSVVVGQEIVGDNFGNANNTSSNMRNYLTSGTQDMTVHRIQVRVVNADSIVSSGGCSNQVPLNLLPYQKVQIMIEDGRKTYRYRHVLEREDSTIGLAYNNEISVTTKYKVNWKLCSICI